MKRYKKTGLLIALAISIAAACSAQQNKFLFTTGIGLIKSPGGLSKVLHPSVAFNSGLEYTGKTNWFAQLTLDFNSLKYDQRKLDNGSPYLFQRTSSSLIQGAISGGYNIYFGRKWLISPYAGGGYLNIGEPRLVMKDDVVFRQEVTRQGGIFGKAGSRFGYKTKIKFLQTIYLDASWWQSPVEIQGARLQGLSLFVGTRMSM
ncbi:MAG TPA: autotransporter outer membrane beta-barrel domain-containing protein [Ferruginibacter sp.]|nr:hypothetical protein [Chitinophagaceae bacterium]HRI25246.1 autotransporter outer membrane beta-barrel domain-containing protein [Ferruginibacter sp.]